MSDEQVNETEEVEEVEALTAADLKSQSDEHAIEADHETVGTAVYSGTVPEYPDIDYEYEVDEDAGSVATKVGTVGNVESNE